MTWAQMFAMALEAFMSRTESITYHGFTLTAKSESGAPVHFSIGSAFVALEEVAAGKTGTIQIGSILVEITPAAGAVEAAVNDVAGLVADAVKAHLPAAAVTVEPPTPVAEAAPAAS